MKRWYQSKTIWFNAASFAVAISGVGLVYVNQLDLSPSMAMLVAMGFTAMQTMGNIYLRNITTKAIK